MKKSLIAIFAVVMLISIIAVTFVACNTTVSNDSIEEGLKSAGYSIDKFTPVEAEAYIRNLETSKMEGLKTVFHAYKDGHSDDEILILVFDNTKHANVTNEQMYLMHDWGRAHAPESDTSVFGTHNNVVWAGSQAAKNAAGLNA